VVRASYERFYPYLYFVPAILFAVIFVLLPAAQTVYSSFFYLHVDVPSPKNNMFIGFTNYAILFSDPRFYASIKNSLIYTLSSVLGVFLLSLATSLVANQSFRGSSIYRACMIIPWAVANVVAAQQWKFMYQPGFGLANWLLYPFGIISNPNIYNLLTNPTTAMVCQIIANIWKSTPFVALILLGGLQSIPDDFYEAAKVDGAGTWARFRNITMPLLTPYVNIGLLFAGLVSSTVIDIVFVITSGGPGGSTEIMPLYLYRMYFWTWDFGVAAAFSTFMVIFSILTMILLIRALVTYLIKV
jgi:ABC-type sugar transport system permease subunit